MIFNTTEFEKNHWNIDKEERIAFCQRKFPRKFVDPFSQTNGDQRILKACKNISTGSLLRLSELKLQKTVVVLFLC